MDWSEKPLSRPLDGGRLGLLGGNEVQTLVKFVGLTQGAFSKLPCDSPGERAQVWTFLSPKGWIHQLVVAARSHLPHSMGPNR